MRVTNTILNNQYRNQLNSSLSKVYSTNEKASTFRNFSCASEDPVGAAQAYSVRRSWLRNEDVETNLASIDNLLLTADSALMQLNSIVQGVSSEDLIAALNGTNGADDLEVYATTLREMQEAMVATMNAKYGDIYLFGGENISDQPFTIGTDGALYYCGVNVDTGLHEGFDGTTAEANMQGSTIYLGDSNGSMLNNYTLNVVDPSTVNPTPTEDNIIDNNTKTITVYVEAPLTNESLTNALQALDPDDFPSRTDADGVIIAEQFDPSQIVVSGTPLQYGSTVFSKGVEPIAEGTQYNLDALASENRYMDIGLGVSIDSNGIVDSQSVFDVSITGLSIMGYGYNSDGAPNNMYSALGKIIEEFEAGNNDITSFQKYFDAFEASESNLVSEMTKLGSKASYIELAITRAADNDLNLTTKGQSIEALDPAEAITDFQNQYFVYNAILQMGTKIIPLTFLDYMR